MKKQTPRTKFLFGFNRTLVSILAMNENEAIAIAMSKYPDTGIKRITNPNLH